MKKKVLVAFSYLLVIALAVTGTVAYLTDTDSDVNVMTLGNVKIEQLEYQRVVDQDGKWVSTGTTDKYNFIPDQLEEFTDDKPLYPAVFADGAIKWDDRDNGTYQQSWGQVGASGSNQLFDDSVRNAQDKFVFVKNTGKSDAYVRTWIAFEQGSVAADDFKNVIMTNTNGDHWAWETYATDVKIAGNTYVVKVATYLGAKSNPTGILAPEAVSYPSLLQVYMKPEATNEDVEAIDGNANGKYDILVFSQAIQANGFDDAKTALEAGFGAEHPWVVNENDTPDTFVVGNETQLDTALAIPGKIELSGNVTTDEATVEGDISVEMDLKDNTLTGTVANSGILEVTGGTLEQTGNQVLYNEGEAVISDVILNMTGSSGYIANSRTEGSVVVFEDVSATSTGGGVNVWEGKAVFKSGSITTNSTSTNPRHVFYVADGAELIIEDGDFTFSPTNLTRKGYYICADGGTVYVKGGNFAAPSTRDNYKAGISAINGGTVIITGGTFGFDPGNWVADGYQAVQSGTTWTVSAIV